MKKLIPGKVYYYKHLNCSSIFVVIKQKVTTTTLFDEYYVKHLLLNNGDFKEDTFFHFFKPHPCSSLIEIQ